MSHGIQQPIFGSASGQGQNDDFDLNEIFAEYFISEFENPVNAYTNGMGNFVAPPGNVTSATATQPAAPTNAITYFLLAAAITATRSEYWDSNAVPFCSGSTCRFHSGCINSTSTNYVRFPNSKETET